MRARGSAQQMFFTHDIGIYRPFSIARSPRKSCMDRRFRWVEKLMLQSNR
jgi:hypothetical protein